MEERNGFQLLASAKFSALNSTPRKVSHRTSKRIKIKINLKTLVLAVQFNKCYDTREDDTIKNGKISKHKKSLSDHRCSILKEKRYENKNPLVT